MKKITFRQIGFLKSFLGILTFASNQIILPPLFFISKPVTAEI